MAGRMTGRTADASCRPGAVAQRASGLLGRWIEARQGSARGQHDIGGGGERQHEHGPAEAVDGRHGGQPAARTDGADEGEGEEVGRHRQRRHGEHGAEPPSRQVGPARQPGQWHSEGHRTGADADAQGERVGQQLQRARSQEQGEGIGASLQGAQEQVGERQRRGRGHHHRHDAQ